VIDAETNDWVAGVFEQAVVAAQAAE
jgi:hypothetical protein